MDPSLIVYFVIALVVALVSVNRRKAALRRLADDWQLAAGRMGLELRQATRPRNMLITGQYGPYSGHRVTIDVHTRDQAVRNQLFTRVSLQSKAIPPRLTIRPVSSEGNQLADEATRTFQLFDEHFDSVVHLDVSQSLQSVTQNQWSKQATEAQALAVLSSQVRNIALDVIVSHKAVLDHGVLTAELPGVVRDAAQFEHVVERLSILAAHLETNPTLAPAQLLRNIREEPDDLVRLQNLESLLRVFRRSPEAHEAARLALSDRFSWIRMLGAVFLGEPGYDDIVSQATSDYIPDNLNLMALKHLAWGEMRGDIATILIAALEVSDRDAVAAAIEGLGRMKNLAALPAMRRLAPGAYGLVARELVKAAVNFGTPDVEPILLDILENEDFNTAMAAIDALAKVGSARAVEPLRSRAKGVLTPGFLKKAAEHAVLQIQSRLGDVIAGALSLVEPAGAEGGLSISQETGQLTLAELEQGESQTAEDSEESAKEAEKGTEVDVEIEAR